MSSNSNQKSSKLSKSGFKGLSRSKKHRKHENDRNEEGEESEKHSNTLNNLPITTTTTTANMSLSSSIQDSLCNKSMRKKSFNMQNSMNLLQTINDNCDIDKVASPRDIGSFIRTPESTTLNEHSTDNVLSNKSKRKTKRKEEKQTKCSTTTTDLIVTNSQSSSVKNKKKRGLKLHSHKSTLMMKQPTKSVNKPIFGVPLEVACSRNPSHDGIILPAFFRHCIDYIEQHGLSSEGIYRVPGVHSQVQAVISAIDNGIEFPDIPPTSATFYCDEANLSKQQRISNFLVGSDSSSKGKIRHLSSSHSKLKENNSSSLSHKTVDSRSINIPKPNNLITSTFCAKNSNSGSGNSRMIQSPTLLTTSTSPLQSTITTTTTASLPHDPAVIASVVKHFLRSLPESILTKRLSNVIESLTTDNVQFYHNLSVLIHQELPVSNRYLLAWIIQHMMHIIDRAGENRMTLANIIIVLSPCLGISHRLLGILLNPTLPKDFSLDLCKLDAKLPAFNVNKLNIDPSTWHWLFPHPIYLLKSYIPPLKLIHDLELPDSNEELDIEFKKQESLLAYLNEQIRLGDELNSDKEYLLRDVQHIMTEIKRRKTLTNPDAIRQEIIKQQAQLDRLHKAITQNTNIINVNNITNTASTVGVDVCSDTSSGLSQSKDIVGCNQRRRVTGSDKHSKNHRHHIPDEKISYSDELWEVQQQLTMLKRKLKQYEKSNELRQCQQQLPPIMTNLDTSPPTLETDESKSNYSSVLYMSGAPLIIPSISELDQEEVLNLTLRKLPIESIVSTTNLPTTSNNKYSKVLDNNLYHNDDKMIEIHQLSTSTIFSHAEITTSSKSVETIDTTTLENVSNECTCKQDGYIDNGDGRYSREDTLKQIDESLDINTIVKDENDHKQPFAQENSIAATMTVDDNKYCYNEASVHHSQNQQEGLTVKSHQTSNTYNQVAKSEVKSHDGVLHSPLNTTPTETNDQKIHYVFSNQNTMIPTIATSSGTSLIHPSEVASTVNNPYYSMNDSPSLPPPSDLAPKLSEFIEVVPRLMKMT
ncbi:RalA-binding protein [Schistosoma japonicum]|uniref:RalA-binding protein n=1 Tax=Schistosoma japonicum TaxID=6182 RepID=A0A4Z2CPZ3_SCHJA|nr:RalA-binding protein [Schistosoma japonicum]